jgi:hypothetical protein
MRAQDRSRIGTFCLRLTAFAAGIAFAGCGGSPTVPETSAIPVATGSQVLRVSLLAPCQIDGRSFAPIVSTRVTLERNNAAEWVGTASTPASGTVEIRFRQSGTGVIVGSMPIAGTIKGTAIHVPELLPLPSATRVDFGSDGRTTVSGFAFVASGLASSAGLDGVGTGAIAFSDDAGHSCSGSSFSWSMAP